MKKYLPIITAFLMITFTSCENNDLMLSEKKLEDNLEKTWKYLYANSNDSQERWTFENGVVTVTVANQTYTGNYAVDAKFSKAYVNLSNFSYPGITNSGMSAADLNRAWTIVVLKDNVLYLSATDTRGAIRSLEYIGN